MPWTILNKIETQTITDETKWTIPSDGLDQYKQYELSIYIGGAGNHPAGLVHASSTSTTDSGYHIPAGSTAVVGPVEIDEFPAILATHGDIDVQVSYAIVPEDRP